MAFNLTEETATMLSSMHQPGKGAAGVPRPGTLAPLPDTNPAADVSDGGFGSRNKEIWIHVAGSR